MQPDWYVQALFFLYYMCHISHLAHFCFPFVYQIICWPYCIEYWACYFHLGTSEASWSVVLQILLITGFQIHFFFLCSTVWQEWEAEVSKRNPLSPRGSCDLLISILLRSELVIPSPQMIKLVCWPWPVDSTKRNADFRGVLRKAGRQVLPDNNVEHTSSVFLCIHF